MRILFVITLSIFHVSPCANGADRLLIENNQPRAEIVIADKPLRTVRLAAQELQDGIEKISGAHLPIVVKPTAGATHLFVGRSEHTDALKVRVDDLKDGAFRMVSGDDWLALVGLDTEFTPVEPWAKGNQDLVSGKSQKEWDAITGALWGMPNRLIYKEKFNVSADTGLSDAERKGGKDKLSIWSFDERGSFSAVCGFLMKLGMRWYAPGDLGEVVPKLATIPLPKLNETVQPDFPMRQVNIRFGVHGEALAKWAMRLGMRAPYGFEIAHGMAQMTDRADLFAQHPEWFAMYGGKRQFKEGANNHLCYSNEALILETAKRVRAEFDHYHMDAVSIMPPDGYTAICQCDQCKGKDSPERDSRGLASDYIWTFVNRVAKEVAKTHPTKKVCNCAYGIYTLPPLKIDKLEPNVVVGIVGGRDPISKRSGESGDTAKLRADWQAKSANLIFVFENYPFTDRGWYLPAFIPHTLGDGINATKGMSAGEDIWLSVTRDFETKDVAFNHQLVYFTQRMYWGGKSADVDAMFREYVRLYYGPAEAEMNAFFDFCEANWIATEKDKAKADTALALFDQAKSKADGASVYGKRLAQMDEFLNGLRNKSLQLGRVRGPVPVLRLVQDPDTRPVIDGKLDEELWVNCPLASTVRLRELQTGRAPIFGTQVKSRWVGHDLYFAIRCDDHHGEKPAISATKKDDAALWYGDAVEVLLETESHSYYQIAIAPNGMVADLDRSASRDKWFSWDSNAEIATQIDDDGWTIEMRLPITDDTNDPLHQVIGHKPTKSLPWHINICRQRVREDGTEASAFSPTGAADFHHPMKFATFYDGNSFQFDAGPPDDDFLLALKNAKDLRREQAAAAYTAMAEGKFTKEQQSHALELAAAAARGIKKPDESEKLIARIPIPAVQKAAKMQHLLDLAKAPQLISEFANEDITTWPFWKRGEGFASRGRAYVITKSGKETETDLTRALEWTSEPLKRNEVLLMLGQNATNNLANDDAALARFHEIIDGQKQLGSATQFDAVHGIALILSKRGKHDEALSTLQLVDHEKVGGIWRDQFRLWTAETLQAAGRSNEAAESFRAVLAEPGVSSRLEQAAREGLRKLNPTAAKR
ncbi:MAG: DUF4838 domain-containing protein [Verrucomicrobiaceae bacterium]|nr:DUF4838 domain-containing protein [Verrucomicrobiaceae bacterium]